jgi:polyisoprenyl-phosphate glycosyltransferase
VVASAFRDDVPAVRPAVSAVVACYRDEPAIPEMVRRLEAVFARLGVEWEVIFVNDASPDGAQAVLEQEAARNPRVKVITHSRSFGAHNAFTTGLARSRGEACVLLDGDLQDPPEVIEHLYAKWREGFDVVYGVRDRRHMSRPAELVYKAFYRLLRAAAPMPVPLDAGSFSLLDRRVVDAMGALPERDRFVQGLRAWVGFRQAGVRYERPPRPYGESTTNLLWRIRWARKGIFSFSPLPVDLLWLAAGALSLSALVCVAVQLAALAGAGLPRPGWIVTAVLGVGALNLLGLSAIAEYAWRVLEEVKARPHAVVAREVGFDD